MAGSILGGSTRDAPGASRIKTVENQSVQPARSDGWENTPRPPSLRARLSRCVAFGRTADLPEEHPKIETSPSRSGRTRQSRQAVQSQACPGLSGPEY